MLLLNGSLSIHCLNVLTSRDEKFLIKVIPAFQFDTSTFYNYDWSAEFLFLTTLLVIKIMRRAIDVTRRIPVTGLISKMPLMISQLIRVRPNSTYQKCSTVFIHVIVLNLDSMKKPAICKSVLQTDFKISSTRECGFYSTVADNIRK